MKIIALLDTDETLTKDKLTEILKENNITLEGYQETNKSTIMSDILNRNDYFATKLWSEDDIIGQIQEMGYPLTTENVNAVLNRMDILKALNDCTDDEWEIINQAIKTALK